MKKHRYFEDFELLEVPGKKGSGKKKVLVYIGDLFSAELSPERHKKLRLIFTLFSLSCCVLQIICASVNIPSNLFSPIGVPATLALVPIFFMTFGALNEWTVRGPMQRAKYHGTALYRRYGSLYTALLTAYCATSSAIYAIICVRGKPLFFEFLAIAGYALGAALSTCMYLTERKTVYRTLPGKKCGSEEPLSGNNT